MVLFEESSAFLFRRRMLAQRVSNNKFSCIARGSLHDERSNHERPLCIP